MRRKSWSRPLFGLVAFLAVLCCAILGLAVDNPQADAAVTSCSINMIDTIHADTGWQSVPQRTEGRFAGYGGRYALEDAINLDTSGNAKPPETSTPTPANPESPAANSRCQCGCSNPANPCTCKGLCPCRDVRPEPISRSMVILPKGNSEIRDRLGKRFLRLFSRISGRQATAVLVST